MRQFVTCKRRKNRTEREKEIMAEENGTGSNAVWAIAFVIIIAIIGAVVYYSGILKTKPGKTDVDINVTAPAPAR